MDGLSGFEDANNFSVKLAAVKINGKWCFITREGKKAFDGDFVNAHNFSDNLAAVQEQADGEYGFIDHSGKYVIKPMFEEARPFAEGLAAVRVNRRWGYVDQSGEMRIPNWYPIFADEFAGGLALVSDPVDGSELYISKENKPQFLNQRSRWG